MSGLLAVLIFTVTVRGLIMPVIKQDGSIDLNSVVTHLSLLEQTIESKDSQLKELSSALQETKTKVAVLEFQLSSTHSTTPIPSTDISSLKSEVSSLKNETLNLKAQVKPAEKSGNASEGGAVFTRWGRTVCPAGSNVLYKGFTGGTHYGNRASSATTLCLPEHPIYVNHTPSAHGATVWGTEYDYAAADSLYHNLFNEDVPCVVCESVAKRSVIMVPARNQCYPGWNLEYWGYLNGPNDGHSSGEYICVDNDPESIVGGQDDRNGHLLFVVESACGSLPCPPYEDKWELTCVVCSQ